jgi:hypothetical protein
MLTAAGMGRVWHHSRAHRFFATARWSLDHVGVVMLGMVVGWLVPAGAPVVIAVDDTLFRRSGRHVHGAFWAYDGSRQVAGGQEKLSRGNTFVGAAVVVDLPFLDRLLALPVLFRLWRPGGPTKSALARELIRLVAGARRDRRIHVIADGAYLCKTLRYLPANVTLAGPLPCHAALWEAHPRTRPRSASASTGSTARLRRADRQPRSPRGCHGWHVDGRHPLRTHPTVIVHEHRCLWYGVFLSQPVRVLLVREPGRPALALITTDATPLQWRSSNGTRHGRRSKWPSTMPNTSRGQARRAIARADRAVCDARPEPGSRLVSPRWPLTPRCRGALAAGALVYDQDPAELSA